MIAMQSAIMMRGALLWSLYDAYAVLITITKAIAYGGVLMSCNLQVAKPRPEMIIGEKSVME